jgi:hypothetical protein
LADPALWNCASCRPPETRQLNLRHRIDYPLFLVPLGLIMAWAAFRHWQKGATREPVRLLRNRTAAERLKAALDLSIVSPDADEVLATLEKALATNDSTLRSTSAESLGAVASQLLDHPSRTEAEDRSRAQRLQRATRKGSPVTILSPRVVIPFLVFRHEESRSVQYNGQSRRKIL